MSASSARSRSAQSREVAVRGGLGQDPVHQHGVGRHAVETEIGERAARLVDHHARGIHHEPRTRAVLVEQDLPHALDLGVQPLERIEHRLRRDEAPRAELLRDWAQHARGAALPLPEVLHQMAQHVGKPQHAQRRSGRRAVDDADVVLARRLHLVHRAQRDELLEAGKHEQLLGGEAVGIE
jgi:hypothetical protein